MNKTKTFSQKWNLITSLAQKIVSFECEEILHQARWKCTGIMFIKFCSLHRELTQKQYTQLKMVKPMALKKAKKICFLSISARLIFNAKHSSRYKVAKKISPKKYYGNQILYPIRKWRIRFPGKELTFFFLVISG